MVVVHGVWAAESRLCLWGEDDAVDRSGGGRRHPFACGAERLRELGGPGEPVVPALLLPSRPRAPLPSPELRRPAARTVAPQLRPWVVPALALGPDAALDLLLELTARGRVLPDLDDSHVARWRPSPEPEDVRRLRLLAAAMPAVCRAEAPATDAFAKLPDEGLRRPANLHLGAPLRHSVQGALRTALSQVWGQGGGTG